MANLQQSPLQLHRPLPVANRDHLETVSPTEIENLLSAHIVTRQDVGEAAASADNMLMNPSGPFLDRLGDLRVGCRGRYLDLNSPVVMDVDLDPFAAAGVRLDGIGQHLVAVAELAGAMLRVFHG